MNCTVTRSRAISSTVCCGTNWSWITTVPPAYRIGSVNSPKAPMWNSGATVSVMSSRCSPLPAVSMLTAFHSLLPCVSIAPLGCPVVPDVYMITATSWSYTGSRTATGADSARPPPRRDSPPEASTTAVIGTFDAVTAADLLQAAAWLHDIGYTPGLAVTGLHALDGARYLRDAQHADAMLCRLVAHHSYAIVEADERGLADVLGLEFEPAPYALSSVLTCCDMTTSPDGELVLVERRLAEIQHRYGPGHLVTRSIQRATPMILTAVEQVHHRAAPNHRIALRMSDLKQSEISTPVITCVVHVDGTICWTRIVPPI
jgi:HD domain